jgi:hypothetical protein
MTDSASRNALDPVQDALEASCDALMTLESIRAGSAAENRTKQLHLAQAMASLRHAIAELRLVRPEGESIVGLGFVCEPETGSDQHARGDRSQASPRRTA